MVKGINSFLNKPLPAPGCNSRSLLNYFLVGLFVCLFLITFQPFDINRWQTSNKLLKLAGFGAVSFLMPAGYNFLLGILVPKKILEDQWTIGKEILSVILVLILIALGNMMYSNLIGIMHISFINFLNALIPVVLLGTFPISFLVLSRHNRLFKRNTDEAQMVNQQLETEKSEAHKIAIATTDTEQLLLLAENEKDKLIVKTSDLLFIESSDNYSTVVFIENGLLKRQMIRSSLKRLETQITDPSIIRCHRTYIIHLKKVERVEGNAAGYKLFLNALSDPIPVSRGFGVMVIARLKDQSLS